MKEHQIPKNFSGFEFGLFAGLTIRQFTGIATWLAIGLLVFLLRLPTLIGYPLIGICLFMAFAFGFLKVKDVPFQQWLANFLIAVFTPQVRVWKKSNKIPKFFSYKTAPPAEATTASKKKVKLSDEDWKMYKFDQSSRETQQENAKDNFEDEFFSNIDAFLAGDNKKAQTPQRVTPKASNNPVNLMGSINITNFPQAEVQLVLYSLASKEAVSSTYASPNGMFKFPANLENGNYLLRGLEKSGKVLFEKQIHVDGAEDINLEI